MKHKRVAAIDAGTNTILMVIAEKKSDGKYKVLRDEHSIPRLGESLDFTGFIKITAAKRARAVLENYKSICDGLGVDRIDIVGTSALRDAKNSEDVCLYLSKFIGAEVRVIPGEEEARLSFLGTIEDDQPGTVIDIGGGSTEIIHGSDGNIHKRFSLNFGAVRITEKFFRSHPPTAGDINKAREFVGNLLNQVRPEEFGGRIYAVAGTPTTVAAVAQGLNEFDSDRINGYVLSLESINEVLEIFLKTDIKDIAEKYGVHPRRADVITAGTIILSEILKHLKVTECMVSTRGLRYGVMKEGIKW